VQTTKSNKNDYPSEFWINSNLKALLRELGADKDGYLENNKVKNTEKLVFPCPFLYLCALFFILCSENRLF
jgi:hypothetical protein